jgi:hypothetical protein
VFAAFSPMAASRLAVSAHAPTAAIEKICGVHAVAFRRNL